MMALTLSEAGTSLTVAEPITTEEDSGPYIILQGLATDPTTKTPNLMAVTPLPLVTEPSSCYWRYSNQPS